MTIKVDSNKRTSKTTRCPYEASGQKTAVHLKPNDHLVAQDDQGVWHIRSYSAAKQVLRSNDVKQAGFQAEVVAESLQLTNNPMLFLEGSEHLALRKQTARFFTPKAVRAYDDMIVQYVDEMLAELRRHGRLELSDLTMKLAVRVAAEVVGLTNSNIDEMRHRIASFLAIEPAEGGIQWTPKGIKRFLISQFYMARFYFRDVRPAIQARRTQRQDDLISHLLSQGYSGSEILTECILFGAAGMVTTREFIAIAAWHFLQNDVLRADYLAADHPTRHDMLHEILRLEPVVGALYRRTTAAIELDVEGEMITIPTDALVALDIYATNNDAKVLGRPTEVVCPQRALPRGVQPYGMSFGDGAHRCPGAYIAIEESDIFLTRFLKMAGLRIEQQPKIRRNKLIYGYEIRDFIVAVD